MLIFFAFSTHLSIPLPVQPSLDRSPVLLPKQRGCSPYILQHLVLEHCLSLFFANSEQSSVPWHDRNTAGYSLIFQRNACKPNLKKGIWDVSVCWRDKDTPRGGTDSPADIYFSVHTWHKYPSWLFLQLLPDHQASWCPVHHPWDHQHLQGGKSQSLSVLHLLKGKYKCHIINKPDSKNMLRFLKHSLRSVTPLQPTDSKHVYSYKQATYSPEMICCGLLHSQHKQWNVFFSHSPEKHGYRFRLTQVHTQNKDSLQHCKDCSIHNTILGSCQ